VASGLLLSRESNSVRATLTDCSDLSIVAHVAKNAQGGDIVVVFSNGGFGGIHAKLLQRLGRS
jgi:UDP-N-acetylmuramate-alanine ligase